MSARLTVARAVLAGSLLAGGAMPAAAQRTAPGTAQADPRWQAWLGCWAPAGGPAHVGSTTNLVCVAPVAGTSAVEIATVQDGQISTRDRIDATGAQRPVSKDGCTGWESAQWSAEGERVYLRSEFACPGGLQRKSSGLMAMSADGEWLDLQGLDVGTSTGVRALRYREAAVPAALPAEFRSAIEGRGLAVSAARTAAAAPLTTADIVEASRAIDPAVVEAWLAERHQGFAVDARRLTELADARVPGRVIDMMVALSYPKVFAVNPSTRESDLRVSGDAAGDDALVATSGRRVYADMYGGSPFGFGNPYFSGFNSGFGYGSGFYSPFGLGLGGYGWYPGGRSVIVVRGQEGPTVPGTVQPRGRAVNGRGYTRGSDGSSGAAGSRPSSSAGSSGSGSSGGSAAGSGSSGSGSSGSSGSGRTAKPRP